MKKAYTLAEVLIVLVIIGVIAGFLVPALNASKPNKNAIMYKKAFYTMEDAVSKLSNDVLNFPGNNIFAQDLATTIGTLDSADAPVNGTLFCTKMAELLNVVGAYNCTANSIDPTKQALTATNHNFKTTNGMEFFGLQQGFYNLSTDNSTLGSYITICVDVNGLGTGSDFGCSSQISNSKKDQYRIGIRWDGKIFTKASGVGESTCTKTACPAAPFVCEAKDCSDADAPGFYRLYSNPTENWTVENDILLSPTKTTN